MKKAMVMMSAAVLISGGILCLPDVVIDMLPASEVTSVRAVEYSEYVTAVGEIEQRDSRRIVADMPVIADEVLIKAGDKISAGDIVMTVKREETAAKIMQYSGYETLGYFSKDITSYDELSAAVPQHILSTESGTVMSVGCENGGYCAKGGVIALLRGDNDLIVNALVSEKDISSVRIGQRAEITGSGFDGVTYSGYVEDIAAAAEKQYSGSVQQTVVPVRICIDGGGEDVKPGYTAKVKIMTSAAQEVRVLPYEAVRQDEDEREYVYVFSGGLAVRRDITTGRELSEGVEIVDGIEESENVLVSKDELVEDGYVYVSGQEQ